MKYVQRDGEASFELRIPFSAFPELVDKHPVDIFETIELEKIGRGLVSNIIEYESLSDFIRRVCA